jgi:hypothetical protein
MLSALARLPACISASISFGDGRAKAKHVVKANIHVRNSLVSSLELIMLVIPIEGCIIQILFGCL